MTANITTIGNNKNTLSSVPLRKKKSRHWLASEQHCFDERDLSTIHTIIEHLNAEVLPPRH